MEKAFNVGNIYGRWAYPADKPQIPENEQFMDVHTGKIFVKINPKFYRPNETDVLLGDSTPARQDLGWKPKISFDDLVKVMVQNDINLGID